MIPPVGKIWLGDDSPDQLALPAKDFPWGQHYNGCFIGFPKRGLLPNNFRGEEVSVDLREILGHNNIKHVSLGIP